MKFFVDAVWDDEAEVWYSRTNIPGLVVEADSIDEFEDLVADLAPEILADNAHIHSGPVSVTLVSDSLADHILV